MRIVYPNLELTLKESELSYSKLAVAIGISKTALYRRVTGKTEFKLTEVVRICQFLETSNAKWLFLRLDIKSE